MLGIRYEGKKVGAVVPTFFILCAQFLVRAGLLLFKNYKGRGTRYKGQGARGKGERVIE